MEIQGKLAVFLFQASKLKVKFCPQSSHNTILMEFARYQQRTRWKCYVLFLHREAATYIPSRFLITLYNKSVPKSFSGADCKTPNQKHTDTVTQQNTDAENKKGWKCFFEPRLLRLWLRFVYKFKKHFTVASWWIWIRWTWKFRLIR